MPWHNLRSLVPDVPAISSVVGTQNMRAKFVDEGSSSAPRLCSTYELLVGIVLSVVRIHSASPLVERVDCTSPALIVLLQEKDTQANIGLHPERPSFAVKGAYLPANSSAWIHMSGGSACRWLRFDMASDAFGDKGLPVELRTAQTLRLFRDGHELVTCADLLFRECERNGGQSSRYLESLLAAVLLLLAEAPACGEDRPEPGGLAPWQFKRATDAMRRDIRGPIDIASIAKEVRASPSHFGRAFKRTTGLTPQAWISKMRIDRAQEVMLDSDLSLAEVAAQVGFSDQSHLTRRFRSAMGMSPGEWRRRQPRL